MAGIEGITSEILAAAQREAAKILDADKADASIVTDKAKEESAKTLAQAAETAKEKAAAQKERALSRAEMESKQTLLAEKQAVIKEVIAAAKEKLCAQDGAAYFGMLEKLLAQTVRAGDGEICFSKDDLARLPADFGARANAAAQRAGGTVKIAEAPAAIANGFILRYGGIEENCSLDALFLEKEEALHDLVGGLLF